MGFALTADHRVKLKENEKGDKYLDFVRELKKLRNMKVTVRLIVVGALGTIAKELVTRLEDFEIRGQVKTIQTLLRSVRVRGRVMANWGDLLLLKLQGKTSANASVKKE